MKKILSISLLLSVLFLYGCSTSNKLSDNQLFEKKQECAKYNDDMLKQAMDINNSRMTETGDPYKLEVNETFYSPELNSCTYVLHIYKYIDMIIENQYVDYILLNKYIYDYFSKKEIISTTNSSEDEFTKKLTELKGE